jgi:hypothetical protein
MNKTASLKLPFLILLLCIFLFGLTVVSYGEQPKVPLPEPATVSASAGQNAGIKTEISAALSAGEKPVSEKKNYDLNTVYIHLILYIAAAVLFREFIRTGRTGRIIMASMNGQICMQLAGIGIFAAVYHYMLISAGEPSGGVSGDICVSAFFAGAAAAAVLLSLSGIVLRNYFRDYRIFYYLAPAAVLSFLIAGRGVFIGINSVYGRQAVTVYLYLNFLLALIVTITEQNTQRFTRLKK